MKERERKKYRERKRVRERERNIEKERGRKYITFIPIFQFFRFSGGQKEKKLKRKERKEEIGNLNFFPFAQVLLHLFDFSYSVHLVRLFRSKKYVECVKDRQEMR